MIIATRLEQMWFLPALSLLLVAIQLWPAGRTINMTATGPLIYLVRSFQHANWFHLFANLWGLSQLSELEKKLPISTLIQLTLYSWIVTSLGLWFWHQLVGSNRVTVGFSGVIFSLMVVLQYTRSLNWQYSVWYMIREIVPQLLIPGISFWGHLIGILTGVGYIFLKGT